jgi:hypothetical protein
VADTVHPASAGLSHGRRLAVWTIAVISGVVLAVVSGVADVVTHYLTAGHQAKIDDDAQSALDADKGYIHASFRLKPYDSYEPPYSAFSKTRLTARQTEGVNSGEYNSSVLKDSVAAAPFSLGKYDKGGNGQIYFVDLVSDSASMLTVTDIDAVNIHCRKSAMVAEIYTRPEGEEPIKGLAYKLQDGRGTRNGFISDAEDPHWGQQYFDHYTITLGGGADHQTLSVLGVANPGSYCTWDLQAKFTTDDGKEHRKKLNTKPLATEAGPDNGSGMQHLQVIVQKQIQWACDHGRREPKECVGIPKS